MEPWQQIMTAAGVGLAALVAASLTGLRGVVVAWFRRVERRVGRDTFLEAIEWVSVVRRTYLEFHSMPFVDRVLLLVTIDFAVGGRVCYVRAFDGWAATPGKPDPYEQYSHKIKADSAYLSMVGELIRDGSCLVTTATMPAGATLRKYYESEGVIQSALYLLRDFGEGRIVYMSIASYGREFAPMELTKIGIQVDQVRSKLMGGD